MTQRQSRKERAFSAKKQEAETAELIDKIYDGSVTNLFAAMLGKEKMTPEQLERLREIVKEWE